MATFLEKMQIKARQTPRLSGSKIVLQNDGEVSGAATFQSLVRELEDVIRLPSGQLRRLPSGFSRAMHIQWAQERRAKRLKAIEKREAAKKQQQQVFAKTAFEQYAAHQKQARRQFGLVKETVVVAPPPTAADLRAAVRELSSLSWAEVAATAAAPRKEVVSVRRRTVECGCQQCEFVRRARAGKRAAFEQRVAKRKHRAQREEDADGFRAFRRAARRAEAVHRLDAYVEAYEDDSTVVEEEEEELYVPDSSNRMRVRRRDRREDGNDWEVVARCLAHLPMREPEDQVPQPTNRPRVLVERLEKELRRVAERRLRGPVKRVNRAEVAEELPKVVVEENIHEYDDVYSGPSAQEQRELRQLRRQERRRLAEEQRYGPPTTKHGLGFFRVGSKYYRPEMADSETPCTPTVEKAGNIVMEEVVTPNEECIGTRLAGLRKFCEPDTVFHPETMDRFIPFNKFAWNVTDAQDSLLSTMTLPFAAIYEYADKDKPGMDQRWKLKETTLVNAMRNYQFMECDMEIRALITASPFMQGQLQMSWVYLWNLDDKTDCRNSIYSLSQTNHVIISPAEGESGTLCIPFKHYKPYIAIRYRHDLAIPADLGNLQIKVLSPLRTPSSSAKLVDVTLFIRFTRASMMGMYPPTNKSACYTTQMFPMMATMAAMKLLNQIAPDRNRDNPPFPFQPTAIAPQASGSLATGTNDIERVHPMRLDAKGQTPHPYTYEAEMTSSYIASKFGLVKTFTLKNSDPPGSLLFCMEATPILDVSNYYKVDIQGTNCYAIPPVGVISSLFAYWRGDLEFRLDFVATTYHQARLFFCWIPGDLETTFTYDQAQSLAGTYYDLKCGNSSVTVVVPYIADQPFWSQRYSTGVDSSVQPAPSRFCCYIVNRLTYTNAVSSTIDILMYMRGGANFEVAQPCQPTIGLSYNPQFVTHDDNFVVARPGYFPWYGGTWRELEGGQVGVLRWGTESDRIAQFNNMQPYKYYRFKDQELAKSFTILHSSGERLSGAALYFVPVDVRDGYGFVYMGIIRTLEQVQKYYYANQGGKWVPREPGAWDNDQLINMGSTKDNPYYQGATNAVLLGNDIKPPSYLVEGNREETSPPIKFESSAQDSASMISFGEQFGDLKDYCRRYSLLVRAPLTHMDAGVENVSFAFPATPIGLELDPTASPMWNAVRDGPIPIILSGYRFFRGGLRYKFIPSNIQGMTYFVQVRQDRPLRERRLMAKPASVTDGLFNHGYATSCQCSSVNPILTCEIPFYLPGDAGILAPVKAEKDQANRFLSLGEVCLTMDYQRNQMSNTGTMSIMYSVADDFTAHTFQGYPLMCLISDSKLTVEGERPPSDRDEPTVSRLSTSSWDEIEHPSQ